MKRIISMIVLAMIIITAAVPAMAGGCDYRDTFGDHNWYQTGFNYPTCTKDGYYVLKCNECGYSKKEENGKAYGHNWERSGKKDATCTEKGSASYWCIECGDTKTETTKALGHKYSVLNVITEASCISEGSEKVKCGRCNKTTTRTTDKTDHVYSEWEISVAATDSAKGVRSSKCIHCGKERTEEFYPEGTLYRDIKDKEAVKELQTWLSECGYLNDKIDGIFGKKSEQAVKDFQEKAGIAVDGIAWPQTKRLLEIEWQKLKGIYVEETVEEVEVIEFVATQLPACCTRIENENGAVEIVYCAEHKVLTDAVDALFEPGDAGEDTLNALTLVRSMYQEELDLLYTKWMESSAAEDQANVVGAQAMFTGLLNMQETAWNKQYGENSPEKLEKINDMLHNQIIEICGILNLTAAE